jgi:hypothetical protein
MEGKPIRFGDEGQIATGELATRFPAFREAILARHPHLVPRIDALGRGIAAIEAIDRRYGGTGALPLEETQTLVSAMLTDLAHVDRECERTGEAPLRDETARFILGTALWAVRHEVPLDAVEPVVNALARQSNGARTKQELAAVFGLTRGIVAHVALRLAADLERSNPERPWRILHANFAITAIRTEDPTLMDHAFDALDSALPDERASFYAEALALALSPGIAPAVRERIEARALKWTPGH